MRITGVEIPDNKRIVIALTYIYGIGSSLSKKILSVANINESARASDLNGDQLNILRNIIADKYIIEGDLRREVTENIKRLREIGS